MFRFLKGATVPAAAALALLGLSSLASADTITGTVLATTGAVPFVATGLGQTDTGFVTEDVVQATTGLVAGQVSGDLDFVYQFNNTATIPPEQLTQLSVSNFLSYILSVSDGSASTLNGSNLLNPIYTGDPQLVATSTDVNGGTADFHFQPPNGVATGDATTILIVYTDATSFGVGDIFIQDGAQAHVPGFAPVPLPATASTGLALLAGLGVIGGVSALRRRRTA